MTYAELAKATAERRRHCVKISNRLRGMGWDVDPKRVNRSYIIFRRWDSGQLALGYLIRQTAIRRFEQTGLRA